MQAFFISRDYFDYYLAMYNQIKQRYSKTEMVNNLT